MSPASVVCAIIAPAWSTAWRATCPWVSWERTEARSASWRVESVVWAFSVRLACWLWSVWSWFSRAPTLARSALMSCCPCWSAAIVPATPAMSLLRSAVSRSDRALRDPPKTVPPLVLIRTRSLADEPPSGQLRVADAGEGLEKPVHLLGRRRAVAGRHRAIGLLGGDLLRPGHDLHGVGERAVLGAEHAQTELHRARVLRERAERRRGAQHLTRGERVGVGGLEALAARDLALERGERRLDARRLGAKLVEYLDVGDAGDHETICMSSSSVLLTTEMTWAEAWKACWKLSRLVSSSLRFTPESASRWFCTCWRTPWLAVASPCACRASSPRRAVSLAA